MVSTKALIGDENGEWELRSTKQNEDGSYSVGGKNTYLPKPKVHIQTIRIKSAFGYKRYKFFVSHIENPVPVSLGDRKSIEPQDTSLAVRSFLRGNIVQGLGKASRELPNNKSTDWGKIILYAMIGVGALILYYSGILTGLIDWFTGS